MLEIFSQFGKEFWDVLEEMAPYLLFGFLFAGLLSIVISPQLVERHLGGRGLWPIVKSTIFGIPLPLCSCGVIPVAASLRRHKASRGATTAFLLSTPQTGVDSILVTFSLLGFVFAVFRPLAALVTGILGGWVVGLAGSEEKTDKEVDEPCREACCSTEGHGLLHRVFHYGFVTLPRDIGKPLIVGLVIAGLISALVPERYFEGLLGGGVGAMFVMMLFGVPVYVCATASVPIAAAFIHAGVSEGAVLVFLMTGPATNAAAVTTIWKIMGRRTALIYLGVVIVTALAAGISLDYVFKVSGTSAIATMPRMLPEFVGTGSAVALLAILGVALYPGSKGKRVESSPQEDGAAKLIIEGMTCSHCAQSVQRALAECAGVASVEVDLSHGGAIIRGKGLDVPSLCRAVESLGYKTAEFNSTKGNSHGHQRT